MPSSTHSQTYSLRADNPSAPTLTSYLLQLISIKKSNLCVSADVHTSSALLRLAEDVGDYICVLKTHADIIDDFSEQTIKRLSEVSRRKNFLLFEDRKFGDIGSMYKCTAGCESNRHRVIRFAHNWLSRHRAVAVYTRTSCHRNLGPFDKRSHLPRSCHH